MSLRTRFPSPAIWLWLLMSALTLPAGAAHKWFVASMAVDRHGQIWASAVSVEEGRLNTFYEGERRVLAIYDQDIMAWRAMAFEPAKNASALQVRGLSDGSVCCLWQSQGRTILTRHRVEDSESWAVLDASFNQPRMFQLADGGVIITEEGPKVARVPLDGKAAEVRTIPDELFTQPAKIEKGRRQYASNQAIQAADGSIWIWSDGFGHPPHHWRTSPFLRWKDQELDKVAGLPFDAKSMISDAIKSPPDHIMVAEASVGLWSVNTRICEAKKIQAPEAAVLYVETLAGLDGRMHWVSVPRPTEFDMEASSALTNGLNLKTTRYYDTAKPTGILYGVRNGALEVVVDGLDEEPDFDEPRRFLNGTPRGYLVGSTKGGPWWLPAEPDAKPLHLGAAHGFHLRDAVEGWPLVDDNKWLVISSDWMWAVVDPEAKVDATPSRVTRLKTIFPVLADAKHQLWAFMSEDGQFAKFSQGQWLQQPGPELGGACRSFSIDGHQQAWLVSDSEGKSAVFDLRLGTWETFASTEQAVMKRLTDTDTVPHPWIQPFSLVSHRNGTKGFLGNDGVVHVLRRGEWTRTKLSDIAGPESTATSAPFFDAKGRFCLPLKFQAWCLNDDGTWSEGPMVVPEEDEEVYRLTAECNIPDTYSKAIDRHGVVWATQRDGTLYKWLGGVSVKVEGPGGAPVLPVATKMERVLVAEDGTGFLELPRGVGHHTYQVITPLPKPAVKPATTRGADKNGAWVMEFHGEGETWHRTKLDDQPWSAPTREKTRRFDPLIAGDHVLQVQTFDAEFTPVGAVQRIPLRRKPQTVTTR